MSNQITQSFTANNWYYSSWCTNSC